MAAAIYRRFGPEVVSVEQVATPLPGVTTRQHRPKSMQSKLTD
jgi:hypothetical protein